MSFFDFVKNLFREDTKPRTQIFVQPSNYLKNGLTPVQRAAVIGTAAAAEQHYIRLWATHMMLAHNTEWFNKLNPAVYSATALHFGDNDTNFANIAGPKQLGELKAVDGDLLLMRNIPMTGYLPFRGGDIRLSCGLVSISIDDLLANFLNTVGDFAGILAQPQVSAGVAIAKTVETSIQNFLGSSKPKLRLYFDSTFTGQPGEQVLLSGFYFLSDAPEGSIPDNQLWVIDGNPMIGPTAASAKPVTGQNYMLIQIELRTERDDYRQFKAIEKPFQDALTAKLNGKLSDAQTLLAQACVAALNSPDLTRTDVVRIITALKDEYQKAPTALLAAGDAKLAAAGPAPAAHPVSLDALLATAIPFEQARAMRTPSLADVLVL